MTQDYATTRARLARNRYRKAYLMRRLRGEPTGLVEVDQAAAHVARLIALGWSAPALEQWTTAAISATTIAAVAGREHPRIERATEAALLAIPVTLAPPDHVSDNTLAPTLGARRRVEALLRAGWPHKVMLADWRAETTHLTRGTYAQMVTWRWRQIDTMYQALHMVPGPSALSAHRARVAGLAPALAWDDIDDPADRPQALVPDVNMYDPVTVGRILTGEWNLPASRPDRIEVVARWRAAARPLSDLARLTGWKVERYYDPATEQVAS